MAGTPLTGASVASTYDSLVKFTDNNGVTASLKTITDGLGADTALQLSTAGIGSTGTLTVAGAITAGTTTGWAGNTGASTILNGTGPAINGGGIQRIVSTTAMAIDGGASIALGGFYTASTNSVDFAEIGGRKANGTAGNTEGYLNIGVRSNGSNIAEVGRFTITGLNSTAIGATTPSTGAFTTLGATGIMTYGGGITRVASNFTVSATTTLANITGLTFTVTAGGTYYFRANLALTQVGNGGYAVGFGGTATATSLWANFIYLSDSLNTCRYVSTQSLGTSNIYNVTSATGAVASVEGTIVVNTGGTFTLQFAQNAATSTSTVNAGSTFSIFRIS